VQPACSALSSFLRLDDRSHRLGLDKTPTFVWFQNQPTLEFEGNAFGSSEISESDKLLIPQNSAIWKLHINLNIICDEILNRDFAARQRLTVKQAIDGFHTPVDEHDANGYRERDGETLDDELDHVILSRTTKLTHSRGSAVKKRK
jgi:hypothetical protein